jgi:hypothetical protein
MERIYFWHNSFLVEGFTEARFSGESDIRTLLVVKRKPTIPQLGGCGSQARAGEESAGRLAG